MGGDRGEASQGLIVGCGWQAEDEVAGAADGRPGRQAGFGECAFGQDRVGRGAGGDRRRSGEGGEDRDQAYGFDVVGVSESRYSRNAADRSGRFSPK